MSVNVFDRTIKALARRYPEPFIRVALGSTEGLSVATIENPEINLPERRLDFVYGLREDGQEYILHLDFQLQHRADMPERMFTYNALLTAAYEQPVISAVIYLERHNYRHLPQKYVVEFRRRPIHTFPYLVIKLWEYEEAIISGELQELAPLLIMLTEKKDEKVLARSRDLILANQDEGWRANALSAAVTMGGRYFPKEFLLKFFQEELKMLQGADIVQDWINQGIKKGLEKGMEKGLEKGMEKGLEKGMEKGMEKGLEKGELKAIQEAILEVLVERFGIIKSGLSKKVAAIDDAAVLRSLHRRSIKVESLEEFARLLEDV